MRFPSNVHLSGNVPLQSCGGGDLGACKKRTGQVVGSRRVSGTPCCWDGARVMQGGCTTSVRVWFLPTPGPGVRGLWGDPCSPPMGSPVPSLSISVTRHLPIPPCPNLPCPLAQFSFPSSYQRSSFFLSWTLPSPSRGNSYSLLPNPLQPQTTCLWPGAHVGCRCFFWACSSCPPELIPSIQLALRPPGWSSCLSPGHTKSVMTQYQ